MRRVIAAVVLALFGTLLVPAGQASAAPAIGELRTRWDEFPSPDFATCMAVDDNSGDQPFMGLCNNGEHQRFTIDGNAVATIRVVNKCLDVGGGGTHNGARLQIWSCNGTPAQLWEFIAIAGSGGYYLIRNPNSGFCASIGFFSSEAIVTDCVPDYNFPSTRRNNLFVLGPQIS
jgi:hypothetical protein